MRNEDQKHQARMEPVATNRHRPTFRGSPPRAGSTCPDPLGPGSLTTPHRRGQALVQSGVEGGRSRRRLGRPPVWSDRLTASTWKSPAMGKSCHLGIGRGERWESVSVGRAERPN
ncbi:unnamed protein product [Arctogadus glacialis]